jgi:DNA-binding MarR family transcriptional regulator
VREIPTLGSGRRAEPARGKRINDLLAAVHILSSTMNNLMESHLKDELGGTLTFSQLQLLMLVSRNEVGTVSSVAAFLGISRPAASKSLDRLVRQGLIRRESSETDRRSARLSLTEGGHRLLVRYHRARNGKLERMFPKIPSDEFARATDWLDRISAALIGHPNRLEGICQRCGIYFRNKCLQRVINPEPA